MHLPSRRPTGSGAQLATDGVQAPNLGCAQVGRPVSSCALSGRFSLSARWPGPPVGPGAGEVHGLCLLQPAAVPAFSSFREPG